jgi:hypothetical protein
VLKINRLDGHPPWSGSAKTLYGNYLHGHATVRATVSHRPDVALKQEKFSVKIAKILVAQLSVHTAQVHRLDGVRIYYCNHPFEPSAYK